MSQTAIEAALSLAVEAMPSLIAPSAIEAFDGSTVRTVEPHGLASKLRVSLNGTTADGEYVIQVLDDYHFMLGDGVVMQPGVGGTVTALLTAWGNTGFEPVINVPWQQVDFVFARPEEFTMGQEFYREIGFMQITLHYPLLEGSGRAKQRAELIRKTFRRGESFEHDGITVHAWRTVEIMNGVPLDESYAIVVRAPFYADIYTQ